MGDTVQGSANGTLHSGSSVLMVNGWLIDIKQDGDGFGVLQIYSPAGAHICDVTGIELPPTECELDRARSIANSLHNADMETLRKENESLRQQVNGMAARIAAQSDIITSFAKKQSSQQYIHVYPPGTPPMVILYKNHRGKVAVRKVIPRNVLYGHSQFHEGEIPQWFLDALDVDKQEVRTFLFSDIIAVGDARISQWCEILGIDYPS